MSNGKPVLGIVGGVGAGKSTVANACKALGGVVVDGDALGHLALEQPEIRTKIQGSFGDVFKPDGTVDRRALGQIVFADPTELRKLEAITWPWIAEEMRRRLEHANADPQVRFALLDAALLLEAGWGAICDRIVFADSPTDIRRERVAKRGWPAGELERRESAQMPLESKRRIADAVLDSSGDPAGMPGRIETLLRGWGWIS